MFKIFMLSGSLGKPSHTMGLVADLENRMRDKGCEVVVWDLRKIALPTADPNFHRNPGDHPNELVRELVRLADEADGIVLASPNYHNSYSGVLKNALDLLNFDQFRNKPVGLVCNGGGVRSVQPLDHLRIVVRGVLGLAIPTQIATCDNDYRKHPVEERYVLTEPAILQRCESFVEQLLLFLNKMK